MAFEAFRQSPYQETPYDVLGVPLTSSPEVVQKAYRNLVKELHSDTAMNGKGDPERLRVVTAAFNMLRQQAKVTPSSLKSVEQKPIPATSVDPSGSPYEGNPDIDPSHPLHALNKRLRGEGF